jgi:hypothetical protein
MPKTATLGALAAAALLISAGHSPVEARGSRPDQIPNGRQIGCAGCHLNPGGGGPRNAFGLMIQDGFLTEQSFVGAVVWGPELAALDADGDGATNGQELGDPDGVWRTGDANPGDPALATSPADPAKFPATPTAVVGSSWAAVKILIQE